MMERGPWNAKGHATLGLMSQVQIHPTALVAPGSDIGADVFIGPYAVIEEETVLGNGCRIGAHAVIKRYTRMGDGNLVAEGAVLGGPPQDLSFLDAPSYLQIGDGNVFREGVTVNRATEPEGRTRIGGSCFLMAHSHVAHECSLGSHVILANNVALAGHVTLGDHAVLGGGAGVHQFCRVGELAMIGGNAKVVQDVLPFFLVDGIPAIHRSLNLVGIRRSHVSKKELQCLKRAYRLLSSTELRLRQKIEELECLGSPALKTLVDFIESSQRGLCSFSR